MKKAKIIPVAFNVVCPKCGADVPSRQAGGSLMWTRTELEARSRDMCVECGASFDLPTTVLGMKITRAVV